MADIQFNITKQIAVLSEGNKGWQKECNIMSWNGGEQKIDIRSWAPDHEKMGKGITLTVEEAHVLIQYLEPYIEEAE